MIFSSVGTVCIEIFKAAIMKSMTKLLILIAFLIQKPNSRMRNCFHYTLYRDNWKKNVLSERLLQNRQVRVI